MRGSGPPWPPVQLPIGVAPGAAPAADLLVPLGHPSSSLVPGRCSTNCSTTSSSMSPAPGDTRLDGVLPQSEPCSGTLVAVLLVNGSPYHCWPLPSTLY
ncbi:hypothetical protein U9M48_036325 [Paspalum notatum var. saurae]|uniref:Uncharacterized protein n=1 Tax=Paspalum notatum var. saurae TaxID=547442 RepID=A0AAQ3X9D9_PASNO